MKLSGQDRIDYVIKMKKQLQIQDYGDNIPSILLLSITSSLECIYKCYEHIRSLTYEQKPNYDKLRTYIEEDYINRCDSTDGIYDW